MQVEKLAMALFLSAIAMHEVSASCNYAQILATAPASRFIDNRDGTVTDTGTGLQWKRCSEGQIWMGNRCDRNAEKYAWSSALQLALDEDFAGKTDWRLPNIKELASIVEEACRYPAIDEAVFPNTGTIKWWTSSPR